MSAKKELIERRAALIARQERISLEGALVLAKQEYDDGRLSLNIKWNGEAHRFAIIMAMPSGNIYRGGFFIAANKTISAKGFLNI